MSLSAKDDMRCTLVADKLRRIGDDMNKKIMASGFSGGFSSGKKLSSGGYGKSIGGINKSMSKGKTTSVLSSRRGTSL